MEIALPMVAFYNVHKKLFQIFVCVQFSLISKNATRDNADMVGYLLHFWKNVTGQDNRNTFSRKRTNKLSKFFNPNRVKPVGWFIKYEQFRVV